MFQHFCFVAISVVSFYKTTDERALMFKGAVDWNHLAADFLSITSFKMLKKTLLSSFTLDCTFFFS